MQNMNGKWWVALVVFLGLAPVLFAVQDHNNYRRGDFHDQLEARRELTRLDPADPNRHRALAEELMSMRDYDGAIVEFRRALSIRPHDAESLNQSEDRPV